MSRGTCASIWDLVWIPLFVYSEAAVQVQRKASLGGGSLFWLERMGGMFWAKRF